MYQNIKAVIDLTRIFEYYGSCILLTLFGVFVAGISETSGINHIVKPLLAVIANLMSFAFAFMINDIEDAEDDAMDAVKVKRNPVSAKRISKNTAYLITAITAVLCLTIYASINLYAFLFGATSLILGFIYSWKKVRLKSYPVVDVISHALFLAALGFFVGVSTNVFTSNFRYIALAGVSLFVFSIFEDLRNELRDYEVDSLSNLKNTVQVLKLKRYEKVLLYASIAPLILTAFYLLTQTTALSKLLILPGIIFVLTHYKFFYKSKNKNLFNYPLTQFALVYIGLVLFLQALFQ
ncbi:hypothetical protein A2W32_04545 [candidate division WWE3 bacterium RBG_16_37_10]|uniref:Prenyltransferase n=1 Tax=candidate division WWE3 bacterium RBG_16_37_10 TaxID=1802610 RepID=A0A1F4V389_UNCKA|nr:MAG: hypothetical protein A2W32_04545 [candidate division WWE3 bacterium RBG_16_37_10]